MSKKNNKTVDELLKEKEREAKLHAMVHRRKNIAEMEEREVGKLRSSEVGNSFNIATV